jgi:hypothetical protein
MHTELPPFDHRCANIHSSSTQLNVRAVWMWYRISGLVVEYIVAIDVTRVRFPADASFECRMKQSTRSCDKERYPRRDSNPQPLD